MEIKINSPFQTKIFDPFHFSNSEKNNLTGQLSLRENSKSYSSHLNKSMGSSFYEGPKPSFANTIIKNPYTPQPYPTDSNFISKNISPPHYNPELTPKQRNYQIQPNEKAFSIYSGLSQQKIQSKLSDKRTETSTKKQQKNPNGQTTLSWTKYISLQLKCQQLTKNLSFEQQRLKQKSIKIEQLQKQLNKINNLYENKIQQLKGKYQKKLYEQKNDYQAKIKNKKEKINELMEKIMDQTKNCLSEEIKTYLFEILNNYTELKTNIQEQTASKEENSKRIQRLEKESKDYLQKILKLEKTISKLSAQLSQANQRLISRSTSSIDHNTYNLVIQAQASQIDQLRKTLENMHDEQVKLRATQTDAVNRLNTFQRDHRNSIRREKSEQNKIITDLGLSLTKKQSENNSLKRQITIIQSKLKSALEEVKHKSGQLATIAALPVHQVPVSVKNKIISYSSKGTRYYLCDLNHEEQIRKLKQRIALLQN